MKNILCFVFGIVTTLLVWGQDRTQNSDTLLVKNRTLLYSQDDSNMIKSQGDSAYIRHDYASAIQIYEELLKTGESADIYYNLGNSYYKLDNIAKAILNYERALLLDPGDSDVRANLEIAKAKTVDKAVTISDVFFVAWFKSLINCLNADVWGIVGIVCFVLLLFSLCVFLFSKRIILKKAGFISTVTLLIFVVFSNLFASQQKHRMIMRNKAIVLQPSVAVRSTPSETGTSLFILHEGYKVEIKDDSMRDWKEIQLEDGKVGWLPTTAIEII